MVVLHVKPTSGTKFDLDVPLDSTVVDFKSALSDKSGIPSDQQRVIFRGQVLKNEFKLSDYGIEEGHAVHLVRGASPHQATGSAQTASSQPQQQQRTQDQLSGGINPNNSGGGNNGNNMADMLNSPMMQNAMDSLTQNPEALQSLIGNSPQMQQMVEQNPELSHVINDPQLLRQSLEMARNPELMREQMRASDRAMSNLDTSPEGYNMLRRLYETVQEPLMGQDGSDGSTQQSNTPPSNGNNAGSASQQQRENPSSGPTSAPVPNPWAPSQGRANQPPPAGLGADLGREAPAGGDNASQMPQMPSAELMQSPEMQRAMQQLASDPESIDRLLDSVPGMANAQAPAGMDRERLRQMVQEAMRNPQLMHSLADPNLQQMMEQQAQSGGAANNLQQMQQMMQQMQQGNSGGQAQPSGQQQGMASSDVLQALVNGSRGTGGGNEQQAQAQAPEERFATQLSQLREMGFYDQQENIEALQACMGNVHAAVERLIANATQLGGGQSS